MRIIHTRLVPVTAAVALLLGACGGDDPSAETRDTDAPDSSIVDGLRAPTPIRLTGDSNGRAVGAGTAEVAATDMMIAPAYIVADYVIGPEMPALPANSTGYVFDAAAEPSAAEASTIAAALGLSGEPTLVGDEFSDHWRIGPDDGTAPSLALWDDAMHSWNYDWGWVGRDEAVGCAVAGEPGVAPSVDPIIVDDVAPDDAVQATDDDAVGDIDTQPLDTQTVESLPVETIVPLERCPEPEPPVGLPSEAEARQRVNDALTAMGVDLSTITLEPYVDEWSASVNATETVEGVAARTWGFAFGANAELQYAWGSAAVPEAVGPYALVDLDTAVTRLQDGSFGYGGMGRVAIMEDLAVSSLDDGAVTIEAETSAGETAVSNETAIAEPPPATDLPEPMPVDVPEGEPVEPEEITVTLVDVQPDLWWVWDVDGSAWLLPAYRFIGDDGGWYTVPAVTDDFLIVEEPPVDPTIAPPPTVPPTAPPTTGSIADPTGSIPTAEEVGLLVGLPLDEFTAAASAYPVRVVEIDGVGQAVTEDFSESRINVAVATVEEDDGDVQYVVRATTDAGTLLGEVDIAGATVIPIVSVTDGVAGYPACGTEPITSDGVTWYPVANIDGDAPDQALEDLRSEIASVDREPSPVAGVRGVARVVAPGPGDDVGTLVVWADGVARWVSDSGNLEVWLVDEEITYDWVC